MTHAKTQMALRLAVSLLVGASSLGVSQVQAATAKPAAACPHDIDYLVGEWEATTNGSLIANVKWEAPAGSCYLVETWSPTNTIDSPYLALLAYDSTLKSWSYLAASPWGQRIRYENGVVKGTEIRFDQADTGKVMRRLSYFKLGADSVRELAVSSSDAGKTWQTTEDTPWKRK